MKRILALCFLLIWSAFGYSQSVERSVFGCLGGDTSTGNMFVTWTVGEAVISTESDSVKYLTQGFNQPQYLLRLLHVKAFIEGFYSGTSMHSPLVENQLSTDSLSCDSIVIELRKSFPPFNLLHSDTVLLSVNGNTELKVPFSDQSYYIVLKHRNALSVWSRLPVQQITELFTYDFSNAADKAFGDNLKEVYPGTFALLSGDINQDGVIDLADMNEMELAINSFQNGYLPADLNADVLIESADYSLVENNFGATVLRP